ncbi:hypothetical protein HY78_14595 [Rhizorhabdus wittichii DC-6]|nr:hypothetical protein HY78_14595 [Rhizorhabdus wittichii DC-6]
MSAAQALSRRTMGVMEPMAFGGTGSVMMVAAVIAWVKAAERDDELVYGIGHLPAWSKAPRAVRDLDTRGIVFAFHDVTESPKHYVIRRLGTPYSDPPIPLRVARDAPPRDREEAALLRLLTREAKAGRPCPSNRELAELLHLKNGDRASYLLKCLAGGGFIRNELTGFPPGRIITIVGQLDGEGCDIRTGIDL